MRFQLSDSEELRFDVYENAKIYTERTDKWHDKRITKRELREGGFALLYNSRLKLFHVKLWWSGLFQVKRMTPYGAVEVWSESTIPFMVKEQRLKRYVTGEVLEKGQSITLKEPLWNML